MYFVRFTDVIPNVRYSEGAFISGSFTGELNADGMLYPNDLTNFSISFSGNSFVSAFSNDLSINTYPPVIVTYNSLDQMLNIGTGMTAPRIYHGSNYSDCYAYLCGEVWGMGWLGGYDYTLQAITLSSTVVPVPAALWLLGSGLIGLVGFSRRKARA